jgi:hypothetical protein
MYSLLTEIIPKCQPTKSLLDSFYWVQAILVSESPHTSGLKARKKWFLGVPLAMWGIVDLNTQTRTRHEAEIIFL